METGVAAAAVAAGTSDSLIAVQAGHVIGYDRDPKESYVFGRVPAVPRLLVSFAQIEKRYVPADLPIVFHVNDALDE
jgi:hypothetical protein